MRYKKQKKSPFLLLPLALTWGNHTESQRMGMAWLPFYLMPTHVPILGPGLLNTRVGRTVVRAPMWLKTHMCMLCVLCVMCAVCCVYVVLSCVYGIIHKSWDVGKGILRSKRRQDYLCRVERFSSFSGLWHHSLVWRGEQVRMDMMAPSEETRADVYEHVEGVNQWHQQWIHMQHPAASALPQYCDLRGLFFIRRWWGRGDWHGE